MWTNFKRTEERFFLPDTMHPTWCVDGVDPEGCWAFCDYKWGRLLPTLFSALALWDFAKAIFVMTVHENSLVNTWWLNGWWHTNSNSQRIVFSWWVLATDLEQKMDGSSQMLRWDLGEDEKLCLIKVIERKKVILRFLFSIRRKDLMEVVDWFERNWSPSHSKRAFCHLKNIPRQEFCLENLEYKAFHYNPRRHIGEI